MKYLTLIVGLLMSISSFAEVSFKVKGPESLSGKFTDVKFEKKGNKIVGLIKVNSMEISKKDKKEDLLEYFDSKDYPTTSFKAEIKNGALLGEYILKGKVKKLRGKITGNKAKFKIPLTDLVTGWKASFLGDDDYVAMEIDLD